MAEDSKTEKNKQERARDLLEIAWANLDQAKLEKRAVGRVQSLNNAERIEGLLWPDDTDWPEFPVELLIAFERDDQDSLLSDTTVADDAFVSDLTDIWVEELISAHSHDPDWLKNKHLREGKLRRLVANRLQLRLKEHEPQALIDSVFQSASTDRLGSVGRIKELVLQAINDRLIAACRNAPNGPEARKALKIFTVLATAWGQRDERIRRLKAFKRGDTPELPFVVRNLRPGALPNIATIDPPETPVSPVEVFPDELLAAVPELRTVLDATNAFLERRGILEQYLDAGGDVAEDMAQPFAKLPNLVQRTEGGVFMGKADALQVNRHERYSLPDGVACAVSIIAALEWLLHQAAAHFEGGVSDRIKVARSITIVAEQGRLGAETKEGLETVFSREGLSIRDSIVHSAFVADDRSALEDMVHGLLKIMLNLSNDLRAHGSFLPVLKAPRWDSQDPIAPESAEAIRDQHQGQLNIFSQLTGDEERAHVFKIFKYVTPDKATIGRASVLFWNEVDRGKTIDEYMALVGLIGAFITCEELFRAVFEIHEMDSIALFPDGADSAKAELVYFDPKEGYLLDEENLRTIFPDEMDQPEFYESISAMRSVRDCLFHGKWCVLQQDLRERLHIVIKIIFALCSTVDADPAGAVRR